MIMSVTDSDEYTTASTHPAVSRLLTTNFVIKRAIVQQKQDCTQQKDRDTLRIERKSSRTHSAAPMPRSLRGFYLSHLRFSSLVAQIFSDVIRVLQVDAIS